MNKLMLVIITFLVAVNGYNVKTEIDITELYESDPRCAMLVTAFLDGDTATLEEFALMAPGTYAEYSTLVIGDYKILSDKKGYYLYFEILESETDMLRPGKYKTTLSDGPQGTIMIYDRNYGKDDGITSPMYDEIYRWLNTSYNYIITPETITEMSDTMRSDISESIMALLPESNDGHALDVIQEAALKYYGIKNFMPGGVVSNYYDEDKYVVGGHGGTTWAYDTIEVNDAENYIVLQYYTDYAATIKSHIVKYIFEEIDGSFIIKDCEILEESPFEPFSMSL